MVPRLVLALASCFVMTVTPASGQINFSRADYSSHPGARAAVTADFNRDGWPDVAHANTGRDTVSILLNQRDAAGLAGRADVAVGRGPFDMTTGDFNRDGFPDLAVANADNDTISVLIGRGTGEFVRTDIPAPRNPRGITSADMNRDGRLDLVYTGFLNGRVHVLAGDGAGGFTLLLEIAAGQNPQGITAADFNNDGKQDLAVAYAGSEFGGLAIIYETPERNTVVQRVSNEPLNVVAAADLNRDGWMDVAAASSGYNRMTTFYGGPSGVRPQRTYLTGTAPRGIATGDLNQDGWIDILTANYGSNTVTLFTAPPHPNGWHLERDFAAGQGSRALAIADYDHDGLLDVATGNQNEGSVTVLWNATQLVRAGFAFRRLDGGYGFDEFFEEVIAADFDHDGRLDRLSHGGIIYFGNGTETGPPTPMSGAKPADVNGDGHVDLVFFDGDTPRQISTMSGDGRGGFTPGQHAGSWAAGFAPRPDGLLLADVDRDGDIDIVLPGNQSSGGASAGAVYTFKGNGDGTFAAPTVASLPTGPRAWVADVDGDATLDLLFTQFHPTFVLGVAYGDGTGAFPRVVTYPAQDSLVQTNVADINHDGRPDVVASSFDGTHLYLGTPDGRLADPAVIPSASYRVSLGDVNGDGHLDIVGNSTVLVSFGRGDGTFEEAQAYASFGSNPFVADMNNDGLNDIVVGHGAGVLLNTREQENTVPTVQAPEDATVTYEQTFLEDDAPIFTAVGFDADLHHLRYVWRDANGAVLRENPHFLIDGLTPGTYDLTVTVYDDRGGSATDAMRLTVLPVKEIVIHAISASPANGAWPDIQDATAASGYRRHDPDGGAGKILTPLAAPTHYFEIWFLADPTQTYKLWVRGRAEGDYWGNDSAWVQFDHSLNAEGAPAYRIGTADGLPFNLEECSGCGVAGWGWEDDGWGAVDRHGTTLRFAQGGWQRLRIQRREDGLSIDQIVLSAEKYLTTRPGTAKNDTTILPRTR